ncbi:hypothetical protein [Salmonirosea aquatica]|uniref:Uncharacterized protein n=1 Tax=Salmonirosea aquatica TaxID=2654236 RepID=A0A7C9FRX9_9BACT|nr:hypothetical protein [Cytophagaceae bacterium SJW1-29]
MNLLKDMQFYEWLIVSSMAPGAVIGIARFRSLPLFMKYVALFFVCSLGMELAADYRMIVLRQNNLIFYHLMTLLQYTFLAFSFREVIFFPWGKKLILLSVLVVFAVEIVFVSTGIQVFTQSPSWLRLMCRTLLLCWILLYLKTLLQSDKPQPLLSIPSFWVCLGILVHFASFLQVGIMRYLIETDRPLALFWYHISIWFDVIFYIICAYALYLAASRAPTDDHVQWDSF